MKQEAIKYIKDNLNLIDINDFGKLYLNIPFKDRGNVTSLLLEADIDPLKYVDRIPRCYLYNQKGIKSIKIPNNVKFIEGSAFSGCQDLKSINIPDSVISIGEDAFGSCSSLTSVTIGDSVKSIGMSVFNDCNSLKTINYKGSKKQWRSISKGSRWKYDSSLETIHCTDGDIKL